MKKLRFSALALAPLLALSAVAQDSPKALQQAFMDGLRTNDAAALAACYAEDAVNFPLGELMQHGPGPVRDGWQTFFDGMRITSAELSHDHLEQHDDTAIAWGVFTIEAEPIGGGDAVTLVGRYMDVARRIDGRWLYVADHASMPLTSGE